MAKSICTAEALTMQSLLPPTLTTTEGDSDLERRTSNLRSASVRRVLLASLLTGHSLKVLHASLCQ